MTRRPSRSRLLSIVFACLIAACTSTPPPTPSPSPTAAPTVTPSPDPSAQAAALRRIVEEVEAQVPPIRRLEPLTDVPDRVIDEPTLVRELKERAAVDQPEELLRRSTDLLVRLGLAEPGVDLAKLVEEANAGQILGFYDTDTEQMTLVQRGGRFGALERMTLAHEFTHALQDQHFDLDSLGLDDLTDSDKALARRTMVEGDATLLMAQWAGNHLSPLELLGLVAQSANPQLQAGLDKLPPLIAQQFLFPYEQGLTFAQQFYDRGGWSAVDDLYEAPPDSTEQVLHVDKYLAGEAPVAVRLPDLKARLGAGWSEAITDVMGELGSRVWLQLGVNEPRAREAAEGWGGDRVASYDGPGGAWAVLWGSEWDTAEDAGEFVGAAALVTGESLTDRPGKLAHASHVHDDDGTRVWIIVGSDDAVVERVRCVVNPVPGGC